MPRNTTPHLPPSGEPGGDSPPRRGSPEGAAPLLASRRGPGQRPNPDALPCPLILSLATAKEYRAALSPLGAPLPPEPGDAVPWRRGGRDCLVVVTGVGPVAAALSLGRAIGLAGGTVSGLVNLGVAGSYDLSAVPLGSPVAATAEYFPEYGLRGPDADAAADARGLAFPQLSPQGRAVFDRLPLTPDVAAAALALTLPEGCLRGAGVTVAGVTADADRAAGLVRTCPEAAIESMEGFAAALAAAQAGVPFLELRTVSNRVGARPPRDWDLPAALAALGRACSRLLDKP